jgi:release factor glutamine methyltransferase
MTISIPDSSTVSITSPDGVVFELITGADVFQPLMETTPAVDVFFKPYEDDFNKAAGFKLADFGAGTGALGIMVKKTYPQIDVTLYENDPAAEKYILANAELHSADVTVNIMDVKDISDAEEFDAVISTPPHIPNIVKNLNHPILHGEDPETAVYGGPRGLDVSKIFIEKAAQVVKPGGYIVTAHGLPQTDDIHTMLEENGFSNITTSRLNEPREFPIDEAVFTIAYKN